MAEQIPQTTPATAPIQPPNQNSGIDNRFRISGDFYPTGWGKIDRVLPDYNPSMRSLATMLGQGMEEDLGITAYNNPYSNYETRLLAVENRICGVLSALNSATISASCSGTTTVITLTLPGLPSTC